MAQFTEEIRVCIDVGSQKHYVAIGLSTGQRLDEFSFKHTAEGIDGFFKRIKEWELKYCFPISVAMEGYNGYARPIDEYVLDHGYRLFNVNNMKLARFKEIFPSPAKSDPIDAWKMFELFTMKDTLPMAKNALQEIEKRDEVNDKLKRFTRRRRDLVNEKTRIVNRLQADLESICPGILSLTGSVDNLWFLNFLIAKQNITQLAGLHRSSLLKIKGIGKKYADTIKDWQKTAKFSPSASWAGKLIVKDAARVLDLLLEISDIEKVIDELNSQSMISTRIRSIPGFGIICSGELAGEIGTISRFASEASLAIYVGMGILDNKLGKFDGAKNPRNVNSKAKAAMMVAVARHIDQNEEAKKYYDKKRNEGKTHNQAIRALGRHLVRVIWSMIKNNRNYEVKPQCGSTSKDSNIINKFAELAEEKSTATCSWGALKNESEIKKENSPCPFGEEARLLVLG
jgi:transposase